MLFEDVSRLAKPRFRRGFCPESRFWAIQTTRLSNRQKAIKACSWFLICLDLNTFSTCSAQNLAVIRTYDFDEAYLDVTTSVADETQRLPNGQVAIKVCTFCFLLLNLNIIQSGLSLCLAVIESCTLHGPSGNEFYLSTIKYSTMITGCKVFQALFSEFPVLF